MSFFSVIRQALFLLDAEQAHHLTMQAIRIGRRLPFFSTLFSGKLKDESGLAYELAGLRFPNRIGLAAGFDKNALYLEELAALGFGSIEIGTVTPRPQEGNPKPRLFRLPQDRALINRMGFNNDGADAIAERLKKRPPGIIIGGNIGRNKVTPNNEAMYDYRYCFEKLYPHVDYFVLNVSSPNTPGLRELQDKAALQRLLSEVQSFNMAKESPKPVFLKIAPDLTEPQLIDIIDLVALTAITGIIATNTTVSREGLLTPGDVVEKIGAGGLSGAPLRERAYEALTFLRAHCPKGIALISSGGIMDEDEAMRRIHAGADIVQLYTGFIYEGPGLIKRIKEMMSRF